MVRPEPWMSISGPYTPETGNRREASLKPSMVWDIKRIPVERESRVDEKENFTEICAW